MSGLVTNLRAQTPRHHSPNPRLFRSPVTLECHWIEFQGQSQRMYGCDYWCSE